MSEEKKARGILVAAVLWIVIIVLAAVAYKFAIHPFFSEKLEEETGSASQYEHVVGLALDSFSGYSVLRSKAMHDLLRKQKIRLDVEDDGADYRGRIKALKSGKVQMAVFTVDSYLAAGAELGDFPASIVLVLDETQGADAVVAYKEGVANIQELDDPEARIVATPDSPSEFLARIVLAHHSLPSLPEDWLAEADGAEAVYKKLRAAKPGEKRAYVLWEPFITKALAEDGVAVLLDSSNLKGYIVDVLVAGRAFLSERPEVAASVVEAYLRAAHSYGSREGAMVDLVMEDAKQAGDKLTKEQAQKLVAGIQWKNTLENYGHFGIKAKLETAGVQHLEDIIPNIAEVLVTTGKLEADPVGGRANSLFYDRILRDLEAANFDPARRMSILTGVDTGPSGLGKIKVQAELPKLSPAQWDALIPVGEMRVKSIAFGRGTAGLNVQSKRNLAELAKRLQTLPQYYLLVVGHARAQGDPDANRELAQARADAAAAALREQGLKPNRVHAKATEPQEQNGGAQSVTFVGGRPPY